MMTPIALLPQEEHTLLSLERGWHVELLNFVQHGAPKIVIALLLALIGQQILAFFVNRMRKTAGVMVGNAHRAAQLRTVAGILRATGYGLIGFYVFIQVPTVSTLTIFTIKLSNV